MPRETVPLRRRLAAGGGALDPDVRTSGAEGWRLPRSRDAPSHLDVFVAHCGVGPEAVSDWFQTGIAEQPWSLVIVAGFAGGLDPALRAGQVVWGTEGGRFDSTSSNDARWSASGNLPYDLDSSATTALPSEVGSAGTRGHRAVRGSVWTVREPLLRAAAKRAAWESLGRPPGAVVDMETAGLVAGLQVTGVALAVCRVVTDTAMEDLPAVVGAVQPDGSLPPGPLIAALVRRPRGMLSLLHLGRRAREGARRLATVVPGAWSTP